MLLREVWRHIGLRGLRVGHGRLRHHGRGRGDRWVARGLVLGCIRGRSRFGCAGHAGPVKLCKHFGRGVILLWWRGRQGRQGGTWVSMLRRVCARDGFGQRGRDSGRVLPLLLGKHRLLLLLLLEVGRLRDGGERRDGCGSRRTRTRDVSNTRSVRERAGMREAGSACMARTTLPAQLAPLFECEVRLDSGAALFAGTMVR